MESVVNTIKKLIVREYFYGIFATSLQKSFTENIATAGVRFDKKINNFCLDINKDFWTSLEPQYKLGVLKHELLHLAFFHLFEYEDYIKKYGMKIVNIAMDLEVNSYIDKNWLPAGAITCDSIAPDLKEKQGTLFYLNYLKDNPNKVPEVNPTHSSMENGLEGGNEKSNGMSKKPISKEEKEIIKRVAERLLKSSLESISQSTSPGNIPGELTEILKNCKVQHLTDISWNNVLRRCIGNEISYRRKRNKRKESYRYEEAFRNKNTFKKKILVAVDTSGSINLKMAEKFFSEIAYMYKFHDVSIDIIECDTEIVRRYPFTKIPNDIKGGGGTSFEPVFDVFNSESYSLLVYFTDGEAPTNRLKTYKRVLWIIDNTETSINTSRFPGKVTFIK
jgi:predicted metal-dependent peptidase